MEENVTPELPVTKEEIFAWTKLVTQLNEVKAAEMTARKRIFGFHFKDPVEGSGNKFQLADGWILQADYKINRGIDEAMLTAKQNELIEAGVPVATLIRQKPELSTTAYKALPVEQRKLFDQVLDIKVGSLTLKIVQPKR